MHFAISGQPGHCLTSCEHLRACQILHAAIPALTRHVAWFDVRTYCLQHISIFSISQLLLQRIEQAFDIPDVLDVCLKVVWGIDLLLFGILDSPQWLNV